MGSSGYKLYWVFEKSCIPMLIMSSLCIKILITNIVIIENDIVRHLFSVVLNGVFSALDNQEISTQS
jgi:hypothetical protein